MFLSKKCQYGLQALSFLATQEDRPIMSREISSSLDIPPYFLAKILQDLSRNQILHSVRGRSGGFRLRQPPGEIKLLQVIEALEGQTFRDECVLGSVECSLDIPCPLRPRCRSIKSEVWNMFEELTLDQLTDAEGNFQQWLAPQNDGRE